MIPRVDFDRRALAFTALSLVPAFLMNARAEGDPASPAITERVEVTATRIPEDPTEVPASITVVTGQDLRDRGATDLRTALFLVTGIDVAPGGDGGPAGSVPSLWGLKEFDAFLLVVDGVPSGGAFNPALATLSLEDVERIEVLRGPAPVFYGSASFVGVIQIVSTPPSSGAQSAVVSTGSYGSAGIAYGTALPSLGGLRSKVTADAARRGFRDDRTGFDRGHLGWNASLPAGSGDVRFSLDGVWLQQDPASPHPRQGASLAAGVPLDANHNPRGAHLDERRMTLTSGYDRKVPRGAWSTALSISRSAQNTLRGFLTDVVAAAPNASGFRQTIDLTDLYLDTHLVVPLSAEARVVAGFDHLDGRGTANGGDFDYGVSLDGSNPPTGNDLPSASDVRIEDRRAFSGLYAQVEWSPLPSWRLDAGWRLNRTAERRKTRDYDFATSATSIGGDSRDVLRGAGSLGLMWTPWRRDADSVRVFANSRNTYKPAAIDFGLDSPEKILAPETARSYEAGVKTAFGDGIFSAELSAFQMDFRNLVVSQSIGGLPALANAGAERFRGMELTATCGPKPHLRATLAYSLHDSRFRDFVTEFGGVPTQLAGKRLEMSPHDLLSAGIVIAPTKG